MNNVLPPALAPYAPLIWAVAKALIIFSLGWMASKWAHSLGLKLFRARRVDEAVARFLAVFCQYIVLIATVIAALGTVGFQTTSLVAVLGSAALAVGLALQGSLSNFASGVMILVFRPFSIDDVVTVGGNTGTVKEVGLFATTLVNADNHRITIPNAQVTGNSIVNLTVMGTRRGTIDVGVAYGLEPARVIEVAKAAVQTVEGVLVEPEPSVMLMEFGESSVNFRVFAWAKSADWWGAMGRCRIAVYEALNAAGIEIPFNQVVVHRADDAPERSEAAA